MSDVMTLQLWHDACRDMQVVIDKLQAGARKAQEVAHKLESPQATTQAAEDLVSALHRQPSHGDWNKHTARVYPVPA